MMLRASVVLCLGLAQSVQPQPVFKSVGTVVSVPVSVRAGNVPVPDLTVKDFQLRDSGIVQSVESVAFETVPIDVTLFFDNSGSTAGHHRQFNDDMKRIAGLLRSVDRFRVIGFDLDVRVLVDWTSPGPDLKLPEVRQGRLSSVYDALYLALWHRPEPGRRHLVLALTDGIDTGGVVRSADVEHLARRSEGVLHWVSVRGGRGGIGAPVLPSIVSGTLPDYDALPRLERAARLTGGVVHSPLFRLNILEFFGKAFDDFRQSYVLRYVPRDVPQSGWHPIEVNVTRPGSLVIRHRQGYLGVDREPLDPWTPGPLDRR